jgi:type II secretory ATPase GspE/PulE/Tfp pilus assembly ATPase PilB-like protein
VRETVTTRVKIMANLDISERRLPQGGRIKIRIRQDERARDLDFRVSCLPTLWGEKIVLRLLDKAKLMLDMTKLGFEPEPLRRFQAAIARPYGIVLVTGPTGSGKTNTLYSALSALNTRDTNIMTAEDPVEFNLRGVNQVQIREGVGLTFAVALREFLRQDPNVILVGEIRDYETAEIAVKAALTGHLVLSTLHTNDAATSVSRLVNMGIEPFLVGTAVNLVQAQRLVRRLCPQCKMAAPPLPATAAPAEADETATAFAADRMQSARLFHHYGLQPQAREQLEDLLKSLPEHIEARQLLVEVCRSLGDNTSAAGHLRVVTVLLRREAEAPPGALLPVEEWAADEPTDPAADFVEDLRRDVERALDRIARRGGGR